MAQYVILIYDDEAAVAESGTEVVDAIMRDHDRFVRTHQDQVITSYRLRPGYAATSVRRTDGGELVVTDGVFTETKEVLGGLYLVDAPDLDGAISLAADVPAPWGGVEVRPIWTDELR
ncbi:YciI family protein [Lapillicoccus sp.]|uniref:YciI family protein n=1 Tax=Lapillicoccus sp. TaxID=1909287 RepID=UPI003265E052